MTLLKPTDNFQPFYSAMALQCKRNSLTSRWVGLIIRVWIARSFAFFSCFTTYSWIRPFTSYIVGVISSSILCRVLVNKWYTLKYLNAFSIFYIVRRFSSLLRILFFPSISLRNFLRATYALRFLITLLFRVLILCLWAITYSVQAENTSLSTCFSLNYTVNESILAVKVWSSIPDLHLSSALSKRCKRVASSRVTNSFSFEVAFVKRFRHL